MELRDQRLGTIAIAVRLYGDIRKYVAKSDAERQLLPLEAGATVGDVLRRLGVPPEEQLTPALNGDLASRDAVLHDGDDLVFFSPMEGG